MGVGRKYRKRDWGREEQRVKNKERKNRILR